jgi:WD40 repeat protein
MPAAPANQKAPRPQEVFISYSRKDKAFVRRLHEALSQRDREAWVDWEDIRPTEEFMQAIYGAIEGADTFIFVLTPDSVASVVCGREIEHAAAHNKRMVPVVAREVNADTVPEVLARLNWIFCRDSDEFEKATDTLISALDTDLKWVHAHTRLLTRAIEWNANGRNNSFVLRGEDLRSAERWLAEAGAQKDRQPTALQTEYIIASRKAAARRQRIMLGAVTFGLAVAIVLAALAWRSERKAGAEAENAKQTFSRSDFLRAADFLDQGGTVEALAYLARAAETSPDNHAAADRIFNLLTQRQFCMPVTQLKLQGEIGDVRFTSEGSCLIALVNGKTVQVWDAQKQHASFPPLGHEDPVNHVRFSDDGKLLGVACGASESEGGGAVKASGYAQIWNAQTGKSVAGPLLHDGAVLSVCFNKSGDRIVSASEDKTARIWDTVSGKQAGETMQHRSPVRTAEFSTDGHRIVTVSGELAVWNAENGAFICSGRDKADASYLFSTEDFYDREAEDDENDYREAVQLVGKLKASAEPLSKFLWSQFSAPVQQLLVNLNSTDRTKQSAAAGALVEELNKVLKGSSIYDSTRFREVKLSPETLALKAENPQGEELIRLNRLLLEDAYGLRKKNQVNAISAKFNADAKRFVGVLTSSNDDGQVWEFVRIFDTESGKPLGNPASKFSVGIFGGEVTAMDSSAKAGDLLVSYAPRLRNKDYAGSVLRWSWESGEAAGKPNDFKDAVDCVRFSPDAEMYVSTCADGLVRFWKASGEAALGIEPLKPEALPRLAQFSPVGKRLLVISGDRLLTTTVEPANHIVEIYRIEGRPATGEFTTYSKQQVAAGTTEQGVISPDGTRIIKDKALYNAKTGKVLVSPLPLKKDLGEDETPWFAKFSPDGKCFVTPINYGAARGDQSGAARLWDGFTGRPLTEALRHEEWVISASFSANSRMFLTIASRRENGVNCAPRIWDVATGRPLSDRFMRADAEHGSGISANVAEFIEGGLRVRLTADQEEQEEKAHAQIWDVALPQDDDIPVWLPRLATLIGGYELNKQSGIIEPVRDRPEGLRRLRDELAKAPADNPYVKFGRWVLSDPAARNISPYSKSSTSPKP